MSNQRRSLINVVCSLLVFTTNLFINFWLSPFVIEHIGVEANGFISLANNFVMYAALITGALNSMTSRFITIEYVKENFEKANLYYNSVFWGKLVVTAILLIPATIVVLKLESFVQVPHEILLDVKLLFAFIFAVFLINSGVPNWECGTYVTNRLDRDYMPNVATSILRCILVFLLMVLLVPKVWYLGLVTFIVSIILLFVRAYNTNRLTPHLKISFGKNSLIYSWQAMKELVLSGIWNSISSVGYMLLVSLDLLICNIYLGATAMGIIALSKTLYALVTNLAATVRGAFGAELTINYAKGDMDAVFRDLNRAMKLTSFIMIVPVTFIIVFGDQFYALWVPTQDSKLLQLLSSLSIFGLMFTCGTQILYNVFSTVNKVKENSIAMLISGICSCGITLAIVEFNEGMALYAIACVSSCVNLVRNMTFTLPATAKYLGFKWTKFFPQVGQTILASAILIFVGILLRPYLPEGSWTSLFATASIFGIIGITISSVILLTRTERSFLKDKIRSKIRR